MDKLILPAKSHHFAISPKLTGISYRLPSHSDMRLGPCGDVVVTGSDRINYIWWKSETHGMVPSDFRRLLWSDWSLPSGAWITNAIAKNCTFKNFVKTYGHWMMQFKMFNIAHFRSGMAGFFAEDHLLLRQIFSCIFVNCVRTYFDLLEQMKTFSVRRPTNFRFRRAGTNFLGARSIPLRVSYRLALLFRFPKLHAASRCSDIPKKKLQCNCLLLLLLLLPITLQRDLGCWPWCCKPLVNISMSVLRSCPTNAIS